jgi:hypothetical protein
MNQEEGQSNPAVNVKEIELIKKDKSPQRHVLCIDSSNGDQSKLTDPNHLALLNAAAGHTMPEEGGN